MDHRMSSVIKGSPMSIMTVLRCLLIIPTVAGYLTTEIRQYQTVKSTDGLKVCTATSWKVRAFCTS